MTLTGWLVICGATIATVTEAVPKMEPDWALTVKGPPAVPPAVKSPELLMVPPPVTDQLNPRVIGWLNWFIAKALNCWVRPVGTVTDDGVTVMEVRVELTVTVTALVAVSPG